MQHNTTKKIIVIIPILLSLGLLAGSALLIKTQPDQPKTNTTTLEGMAYTVENIPELTKKAEEIFNTGDYEKTIEIYTTILEIDPTNAYVYGLLGHTYRYWYKFEESEKAFLKAIEYDPDNAFMYTDLGKLYRNMHNFEKADWAFKESLKLDPDNATTYSYGLGYLYFEFQRYEESEEAFLKAMSIDPTLEMAYMGLGDLYREMGRYEESEDMYTKAFEINPYSESYLGLAWLYIYEKRFEEAEAPLLAYLKNVREKGEVYYALGQAYMGGGKYKQAKEAFERAISLTPTNEIFKSALEELTKNHPEV